MFNILNSFSKKPGQIDYLVIGLGNPGEKYAFTRHNAGFLALDYIAKELNVKINHKRYNSLFVKTNISGKSVLLIKPQTFMNLSGEAIVQFMNYYKIKSENCIIIFDDISLEPGKLRIRAKGSSGGHNGIKNIIQLSKTENFSRIKLGVGNKPSQWDLASWVTSKLSEEDFDKINMAIKDAYVALELILNGKIADAMNKFN